MLGRFRVSTIQLMESIQRILSITNFEELLEAIIREAPGLVNGSGCSIYLIPEFVGKYDGRLVDGKGKEILASELDREFVVLAATSRPKHKKLIGQAFYVAGSGLTGWIFQHGQPLCLPDMADQREIQGIDSDLEIDSYRISDYYYRTGDKKPFLGVPIYEDGQIAGVIGVYRTDEGSRFSVEDLRLLETVASRLTLALTNFRLFERLRTEQDERLQLVVSLGHEINTPIQSMLADAYNIRHEVADPELKRIAEHSIEEIKRLHLLSENIFFAFSSEEFPKRAFSKHSIYRPLKDACDLFRGEAEAKGCIIGEPTPVDSPFPDIEMSLFDLTFAFRNLVHNAVKYSFSARRERERFIRVTGQWVDDSRQRYAIEIQNYGVGITQEEIETGSIFEPEHRGTLASDRHRTGGGLGLAQARRVIEDLHRGKIEVKSEPMGGGAYLTTFTVILPVKQPE